MYTLILWWFIRPSNRFYMFYVGFMPGICPFLENKCLFMIVWSFDSCLAFFGEHCKHFWEICVFFWGGETTQRMRNTRQNRKTTHLVCHAFEHKLQHNKWTTHMFRATTLKLLIIYIYIHTHWRCDVLYGLRIGFICFMWVACQASVLFNTNIYCTAADEPCRAQNTWETTGLGSSHCCLQGHWKAAVPVHSAG